ncbi:HpcH/HpaI aldolase family protein [Roseiflexus castenholzii]|uniref:HpcH/HpaI aldolase n=1 Tax=Roseiflexus castenholzii (strain DSM 13941 / HLO8) TaxID=383372 RepID=A7NHJ6_ROSCS|nr:aldolase/citrate lyase family protein [Roseiflexus castenholzii]ABU56943.1 HpcH/HpaI aldolase [Roseiflexus castenholzii DSM 13941]
MLPINRVKQALKAGHPVYGTMLIESASSAYVLLLAHAGYDFVFIDMEHGVYDLGEVAGMIRVARLAGLTPLVRIPDLAYDLVARTLDAGAMGIMLPRVETVEQAQALVRYMKYPPEGVRGAAAGRGHTDYRGAAPRDLVRHMNEHTLVILQIERLEAVRRIDDLFAVPGVDVGLIGPFDLAISLGAASVTDSAVEAAIAQVLAAARRAGVACGIHSSDPQQVAGWKQRGMTMLMSGSDTQFFSAGAHQALHAMRQSETAPVADVGAV